LNLSLISSRKGKMFLGGLLGILSWALVFLVYAYDLLEPYELKTYDVLCRFQALRSPAPPEVVLIAVDQGSLEAATRQGINWPWPRQMYAPIVQYCAQAGAKAIAFDVLFTEPSSYGVEDDQILAESLTQNGHAFLAIFLSRQERPHPPWEKRILQRIELPLKDQAERTPPSYASIVAPIEVLAEHAKGLGNVAILPDTDGIYRRLPLVFHYQDRWLPSLGLAVYRSLVGNDPLVLR